MEDPRFRSDLYRGTAQYYERYRLGYPSALIRDLTARISPVGTGNLLDLACGTGQISFALRRLFREIWAVDQEQDMVAVCEEKVATAGGGGIRCIHSSAEGLSAPDGFFELIAVGNAFHRLDRERVARQCLRWLEPRRHLALLWGGTPWRGPEPWQAAMASLLENWMTVLGVHDRIPAGHEEARRRRPDLKVLADIGFDLVGSWGFREDHWWTAEELIGFVYSTSLLPPEILSGEITAFEADLRRELRRFQSDGRLHQVASFAYELVRSPA